MLLRPFYLMLYAEGLWRMRRHDEARAVLDEAEAESNRTSQHMLDAEIHRLRGEVLVAQDPSAGAAAQRSLERAIAVAREAGARSLELRAARSLAALFASSGDIDRANATLVPILSSFEEGLDTLDLVEARGLLEAL
jgi:predicted ATPase